MASESIVKKRQGEKERERKVYTRKRGGKHKWDGKKKTNKLIRTSIAVGGKGKVVGWLVDWLVAILIVIVIVPHWQWTRWVVEYVCMYVCEIRNMDMDMNMNMDLRPGDGGVGIITTKGKE